MKYKLMLLICLSSSALFGQSITKTQALEICDQLHQRTLLSEVGVEKIKEKINEVERADYRKTLLDLCHTAFFDEYCFRHGVFEMHQMIEARKKQHPDQQLSREQFKSIRDTFKTHQVELPGWKLEAAIEDEDQVPEAVKNRPMPILGNPQGPSRRWIHDQRSVMGKHLSRTLKDLLEVGLISPAIFSTTDQQLKAQQVSNEAVLIGFILHQIKNASPSKQESNEENVLVQRLSEYSLLKENSLATLNASDEAGKSKTAFELIAYCKSGAIYDINDFSDDLIKGYKELFGRLKAQLPGFDYQNLDVSLRTKLNPSYSGDDFYEKYLVIRFDIGDRTYAHAAYFQYFSSLETAERATSPRMEIIDGFQQVVNKWLVDQPSNQRLYYASHYDRHKGERAIGLLLMTPDQFKAWEIEGENVLFEPQEYEDQLNSEAIANAIKDYQKLGLFHHLSDEEIELGRRTVEEQLICSYSDILSCFPKTLVCFSWESNNLINPYEELTQKLAVASRGTFTPTDIIDEFDRNLQEKNQKTSFGFTLNGRQYDRHLNMQTDWLDHNFLYLIEHAIQENIADGKFYYCPVDEEEVRLLFLNQQQHQELIQLQSTFFESKY